MKRPGCHGSPPWLAKGSSCTYVYIYIYIYTCYAHAFHLSTHMYKHIYVYIRICVYTHVRALYDIRMWHRPHAGSRLFLANNKLAKRDAGDKPSPKKQPKKKAKAAPKRR